MKELDIASGVELWGRTEGGLLIDVRSPKEYGEGHIPGSINVPLQALASLEETADKAAPLFLYCLSGGRSRKAAVALEKLGYTDVTTIGGIDKWTGPVER